MNTFEIKKNIDELIQLIPQSARIVVSMAAAEPTLFYKNIHRAMAKAKNWVIYGANPTEPYPCFSKTEFAESVDLRMMFLTHAVRSFQGKGLVHYVPQHLSQWSRNLLADGPIDVFWGSCSPPDERGFVSLGVGACYEPDIIRRARIVILEINQHMPLTWGGTQVPLSKVNYFVENHHELFTLARETPDDIDEKIAAYVADLIPNGATLQLGIGSLPNAIADALMTKKDLGVHTEMINDAIVRLAEAGVVTGDQKTIWPGKIVGAFALGSKTLYQFLDRNPMVELHPASVVNDPYRIGRNSRMISINTAVEIDITGQVCSESVGHRELSGVGGASDTHVGAQRSNEGRGIIALRSTTADGQWSKIVGALKSGAKVSISRNDVDTVITEFGVALLRGKSVSQRARALIEIAHPKYREELLQFAIKERYI